MWSLHATAPVSDTRPTFGPPVPRSTARTNRSWRGSGHSSAGDLLVPVHHVGHDRLDEAVGLVGHAAGHAAVDGAGLGRLVFVLPGVDDGVGEVDGEGVGHAGLGLGSGHGHVQRVRVLLAVEAPAPQSHEVVDVVDVEVVRGEAEQERRLAEELQLGMRAHRAPA